MYIYILCLVVIFALYIILYKVKYTKYSKKIFCISIFVIFTLIQGLRSEIVGTDTSNYIKYYLINGNISFSQVMHKTVLNFEIGFGLLMKILYMLHCSPQVFLLIVAAIINGRCDVFYI